MSDAVNNPPHYNQGGIETIDGIRAALGGGFVSYCRGNVLKYVWRCGKKGDAVEDLRKAAKYLEWAIEALEAEKKPETLAIPEGWRELEPNETPLASDMVEHGSSWIIRGGDSATEYEWYGVRMIRKIETEHTSESQSGSHVEGVWVEEAGEAEPTEWIPKVGDKVQVVSGFMNPIGEVGFIKEFCAAVAGNFTISTNDGSCTLGWFSKDDVKLIEAAQ